MTTKAKPSRKLSLKDRLSRLTMAQAVQLLGEEGERLIIKGAAYDEIDIDNHVYLRGDLFRLTLPGAGDAGGHVRVTLTLMAEKRRRLVCNCDSCQTACEHMGAALSLILEDKYALGLADIPKEGVPSEQLSEEDLLERAIAERRKRAKTESFRLKSSDSSTPWTEYSVTSALSGRCYHVALRGSERGDSYCSCPDFRVNTLGTCKHILYALDRVQRRFSKQVRAGTVPPTEFAVRLFYSDNVSLRLVVPQPMPRKTKSIVDRLPGTLVQRAAEVNRLAEGEIETAQLAELLDVIKKLERLGHPVTIYPDAEQWIQQQLHGQCIAEMVAEIRRDPETHPLRKELLKTELLPYQLDGIAFAVGSGRAILADDMGLGKTIQGIGTAELLSRVADVSHVLVVCPASLKSQWRNEITRFSDRDCQIVIGSAADRYQQYSNDCFFTICNYEQVLRDYQAIDETKWDLIILDEGQRIKNWESKTSNAIKSLESTFALVLSGTPLENRLDELYSVVQFIDDRRLGPGFRFFHRHRVVDERGKVIGYKNLDLLRRNLSPLLLRRTREDVLQQLPERTVETVRIPATAAQRRMSCSFISTAAQIASKKFLTEIDLLRIQKALLAARMAADSTFLVNKEPPGESSKLEYLEGFLERLFAEPGRKAVLFSEWTTMLNLIEPLISRLDLDFVRLDGSVPQRKRQQLVNRFQTDADCKLFLTTNAGSTGLNLQAANTVINVDLPWNPAVLEQRIGRAHRMGQKRPVDVYVLVTEGTMEERMLLTLADKRALSLAVLDPDSDVTAVDFQSGIEEMKRRLEVLLGSPAAAPVDRSSQRRVQQEIDRRQQHKARVAAAGGELLGAMFQFLGELVNHQEQPDPQIVASVRERLVACVDEGDDGQQKLTLSLPNRESLDQLSQTLAHLLGLGTEKSVPREP